MKNTKLPNETDDTPYFEGKRDELLGCRHTDIASEKLSDVATDSGECIKCGDEARQNIEKLIQNEKESPQKN